MLRRRPSFRPFRLVSPGRATITCIAYLAITLSLGCRGSADSDVDVRAEFDRLAARAATLPYTVTYDVRRGTESVGELRVIQRNLNEKRLDLLVRDGAYRRTLLLREGKAYYCSSDSSARGVCVDGGKVDGQISDTAQRLGARISRAEGTSRVAGVDAHCFELHASGEDWQQCYSESGILLSADGHGAEKLVRFMNFDGEPTDSQNAGASSITARSTDLSPPLDLLATPFPVQRDEQSWHGP
jgi:hypothetical protein